MLCFVKNVLNKMSKHLILGQSIIGDPLLQWWCSKNWYGYCLWGWRGQERSKEETRSFWKTFERWGTGTGNWIQNGKLFNNT